MRTLRYLDFELKFIRTDKGRYSAHVVRSPEGEGKHEFSLALDTPRIDALLHAMSQVRVHTRDLPAPQGALDLEPDAVTREVGQALFESAFGGLVDTLYRLSLRHTREQPDTGLRIKLRLQDAPELAELPWEFMFDPTENKFLSQSIETPVVRYLELPRPVKPLAVALPLQILVVVSSPVGHARLDVQRERDKLDQALAPLLERGQVQVTYLERATAGRLRSALRDSRFHILHYIGHGGFDPDYGRGVLVLEDDEGHARTMDGHRLATLVNDSPWLRLVVLNACEGARASREDSFASVATTMVQQGVPAVVAMQFEITDDAAIELAGALYAGLARGVPIDAAVSEARVAVYTRTEDIQWGTPILFMRASDGALFTHTDAIPPGNKWLLAGTGFGILSCGVAVWWWMKNGQVPHPDVGTPDAQSTRESFHDDVSGMTFVPIPGGRLVRPGADSSTTSGQIPGFYMSESEVTWKQWLQFMPALDRNRQPSGCGRDEPGPSGGDNAVGACAAKPVTSVTWEETLEFLNKLSHAVGEIPCYESSSGYRNPGCTGYRLPTADEWAYACQASTSHIYGVGDDADTVKQYADYDRDWTEGPVAVKGYKPNRWNVYDMNGSVREWVWQRQVSGGAFNESIENMDCAHQTQAPSGSQPYNRLTGFRVARDRPRSR